MSAILPRLKDDDIYCQKVKEINSELEKSCIEWGVSFIKSNKIMLKYGKPVSEYYHDGLHLNKKGVLRLRQFFSQKLAELGCKPMSTASTTVYLRRHEWKVGL
jgi:hypothetical protein